MLTTATDILLLPLLLTSVLVKTCLATIRGSFIVPASSYGTYISNAGIRAFLGTLRPTQFQLLMPSFLDSYKSDCRSKKTAPDIVDIPNTAVKAFWVGDKTRAKHAMLYIHGGGFVLPGSPGHLMLLQNMVRWSNRSLAILAICYTLAPEAVYPSALGQCVEGLRYLLSQPGREPKSTLVAGDSAGASLVLGVLSHISGHAHPSDQTVRQLDIDAELEGAVLISPWISSDNSRFKSMSLYAGRDIFTASTAQKWLTVYTGRPYTKEVIDDPFICPAHVNATWWEGAKCKEILCTAGNEEALIDSIIDWGRKYEDAGRKLKLVLGQKETHIAPVMNTVSEEKLALLGERTQEAAIRMWVMEKLSS